MPLVLAIEPDLRQATILKRIVREKVHAEVAVVDSPDAALSAIRSHMPDVLLLSALLSPRDESELIAHLRTLNGSDHIQTHTIPQLASTAADVEEQAGRRGLLGVFKRKKDAQPISSGCDPDIFADEIKTFLKHAEEKKADSVAVLQSRANRLEYVAQSSDGVGSSAGSTPAHANEDIAPASTASSWASPFEWRKNPSKSPAANTTSPAPTSAPIIAAAETVGADQGSFATTPEAESARPVPELATHESYAADLSGLATDDSEMLLAGALESSVGNYKPASETGFPFLDMPEPRVDAVQTPTEAPEPVTDHGGTSPSPHSAAMAELKDEVADPVPVQPSTSPATPLRLTPLAMWARADVNAPAGRQLTRQPEPLTVADELRHLMAGLAVPAHVAGVGYARGCRIRRVRVPGGKDRRGGETPGPVILSRRVLDEQREANT
jgi:CheY-like chemotaxis protein